MPDDWRSAGDMAAQLAAWTHLSADRFALAYTPLRARQNARDWRALEADVQRTDPRAGDADVIRAACVEALAEGFLETLARSVGHIESDLGGRNLMEVGAMLQELAGSGVMQAMTDPAKGLMDAKVFRALDTASQACALVYAGETPIGTGFLVAPDLVLTAGHVVLDSETPPAKQAPADGTAPRPKGAQWISRLKVDLAFSFAAVPGDPAEARVRVAAAPGRKPVSYAFPHGDPPKRLERKLVDPAGDHLDFALVRLARQVQHVAPIDIAKPDGDILKKACFVIGYPGGTALKFDAATVTEFDPHAGRLLHRANVIAGMSGGCCIGSQGLVIGLHEGSLPDLDERGRQRQEDGRKLFNNRGISMVAIRARQCLGADPLLARPRTQGLELFDPGLVELLFRNGLRLAGAALADRWRMLVQGLMVLPELPGDGLPMPPFHPWFQRREFEGWIDDRTQSRRVCHVFGDEGVGKSFCVEILRARLAEPAINLFAINATQTNAMAWADALGLALDRDGFSARAAAGKVRYDDIPGIIDLLAASRAGRRSADRPLFVAIDFGHKGGGSLAAPNWQMLVAALAREEWARLVLIGLDLENRAAIDNLLASHPLSQDILTEPFPLSHLGQSELARFARALSVARGVPISPDEAANRAAKIWGLPLMLHSDGGQTKLQTSEAALAAIAIERTLGS